MSSLPGLRWAPALLVALLCLLDGSARAQGIELYEGEAEVDSQSDAARQAALPRALGHALIRLTGDLNIANRAGMQGVLAGAAGLMQHYRYRHDALPGGASRTVLIARFQRAAVDTLLAEGGNGVWPTPRPVPVVWLAIDDGRGPRLLSSAQAGAVAALTERAHYRGLSLAYPLLDLEEQQKVALNAFWAGDSAAARRASPRYQSRLSVVGKLYRSASGWTAEWRLYDGERLLGETIPSAPEATAVLAAGADLVVDLLAGRAASMAVSAGPSGRYQIWVEGILDAEDYARTLNYFTRLSVVRSLRPLQVEQQRLQLELDLRTGLEGLQGLIEAGSTLQRGDDEGRGERVYRLLP